VTSGHKLAQYEILESIGKGGMGEVYRARDSKLGREVAIKVLPEAFAQDKDRLARFEREARLLASVNHPGVATLYEHVEIDGLRFLSMELVHGETLSEKLERGALSVEEALPLLRQIVEALQAAHDKASRLEARQYHDHGKWARQAVGFRTRERHSDYT
jgi:serine/threonine protein kinase